MSGVPEDQRLVLARMHALAMATLTASDAEANRGYLGEIASYAPDLLTLPSDDPRSDESLGADVEPAIASSRFAARIRGVVLGAAIHADAGANEVAALAWAAVESEGVSQREVKRRATAALKTTREDLHRDVVRLAWEPLPDAMAAPWVRRWGGIRSLELNAFVAAFTRDGTHAVATQLTRDGRAARALRFAVAVAQAAMSLASDSELTEYLIRDIRATDPALPPLLASIVAPLRT